MFVARAVHCDRPDLLGRFLNSVVVMAPNTDLGRLVRRLFLDGLRTGPLWTRAAHHSIGLVPNRTRKPRNALASKQPSNQNPLGDTPFLHIPPMGRHENGM